jgi:hypothetical protein
VQPGACQELPTASDFGDHWFSNFYVFGEASVEFFSAEERPNGCGC